MRPFTTSRIDHCCIVSAAAPAWRDQRFDQFPFVVGEVAGIAQMAAVIPRAVFIRPHRRLLQNQATSLKSQIIHQINFFPDIRILVA